LNYSNDEETWQQKINVIDQTMFRKWKWRGYSSIRRQIYRLNVQKKANLENEYVSYLLRKSKIKEI
jgi:hypothetical protein